jgi:ABC-2 type transport system permease protein
VGITLRVVWHEILVTLRKRSFWVLTFVLPIIILVFTLGSQLLFAPDADADMGLPFIPPDDEAVPVGIVDRAGIVQEIPAVVPEGFVVLYADEGEARAALGQGAVTAYHVVHADYVESGRLDRVEEPFNPFGMDNLDLVRYVLAANILQDEQLAALILDPTATARRPEAQVRLAPEEAGPVAPAGSPTGLVPYAVLLLMFFIITTGGEYVSESVAGEKENRTAELLLVTLNPRDLMLGKILAMGLVSLLQVAVWVSVSALVLSQDWLSLAIMGAGDLGPSFVVYAVLYMLLGYLVYASALAVVGALSRGAREVSQWQWIIMAPLFLTLFLNWIIVQQPQAVIPMILSLFPLTSPLAMLTRMTVTPVPTVQAIVGLLLLAATACVNVLIAARSFRADALLSDEALSAGRLFRQVRRSA